MRDHRSRSSRILLMGLCSVLTCLAPGSSDAFAKEEAAFPLWSQGAPRANGDEPQDRPQLIPHLPATPNGTAVVVCPGGGYGGLAMDHEGKQIGEWFNSLGISAFIVDYRHRGKGYGHPAPLEDAQRALRIVRANARQWQLKPDRIGIMGFSAGGHLASTLATHFDAGNAASEDPIQRVSCRPDFAILCYPVIAFDEPYTHRGSQKNLLGENADPQLVRSLSNEKQVTDQTPPTFLFHTTEDKAVPPENSVQFYLALVRAGVPCELHIFEKGRHGVGLGRDIPGTRLWSELCVAWLRNRGVLD